MCQINARTHTHTHTHTHTPRTYLERAGPDTNRFPRVFAESAATAAAIAAHHQVGTEPLRQVCHVCANQKESPEALTAHASREVALGSQFNPVQTRMVLFTKLLVNPEGFLIGQAPSCPRIHQNIALSDHQRAGSHRASARPRPAPSPAAGAAHWRR